jgi:hypothetical protein
MKSIKELTLRYEDFEKAEERKLYWDFAYAVRLAA